MLHLHFLKERVQPLSCQQQSGKCEKEWAIVRNGHPNMAQSTGLCSLLPTRQVSWFILQPHLCPLRGVNRHIDKRDAVSLSRFLRGCWQNPIPKGVTENKQPGKVLEWIKGSVQGRKPVRSKYSNGGSSWSSAEVFCGTCTLHQNHR